MEPEGSLLHSILGYLNPVHTPYTTSGDKS